MAKRGENLRKGKPRPWQLRGSNHPQWKGDDASPTTKRNRARRKFKLGPCIDCGKPGTDRHHIDGDPGNNAASNVAILCRRCHMKQDGRIDALSKIAKASRELRKVKPQPCSNCKQLSKPLRRGLCHACNEYQRRTGKPRPYTTISYQKTVEQKNSQPCLRCRRPANIKGYPTRGYCASCYAYVLKCESFGKPIKPFRTNGKGD